MRSKAYMSQINLQHGTTTDRGQQEEWKTKEWKRICSEVSVNSPGNPCSQSGRRKGRLRLEGFPEKDIFKPGVEEWRGDRWWKWWVDGTDVLNPLNDHSTYGSVPCGILVFCRHRFWWNSSRISDCLFWPCGVIGKESVPVQLAQCWFPGLAISNAKI